MRLKINWDALGVGASVACAIHCAILPIILSSLPIFGINIIDNKGFEYFMIFAAFAIGAYALSHGYRKHHKSMLPLIIFSFGMIFLFSKEIWHQYSIILLVPAVTLIVAAHYINFKMCRKISTYNEEGHVH
ncbi:MAG TPA: MerC domain-containing protein [Arachidicoccus soli]|uniref:MerC domain-containing protein n=1 Tax=Arachidicoccus soli TaxID=2341117 RepID=A0A386HKQ1_9BACT|nr:MerC domain-containing protein [Arachidicoccus soli]AYD46478.1 MerC domain-containing protein [Arachidicoccus soli]HEU0228855.1 MerC domain-containing protein [Arachidicoccus soli]